MTIAMLMMNTLEAAKLARARNTRSLRA
jgi:5,10-methylene-tetrahydrofolate dehydrogenase/methenyl tetrahydrofolate cyclohydrolase